MHGGVGILRRVRFRYSPCLCPHVTPNILLAIAFSVVYMAKYQYVMSRICLNISEFSKSPDLGYAPNRNTPDTRTTQCPTADFGLKYDGSVTKPEEVSDRFHLAAKHRNVGIVKNHQLRG